MFSCVLGYVILLHRRSFEFDFRLKKAAHSCITPFICIPKFFIEDCMGHQKHGRNPSSCQVSINAGLTVLANFIFLLVVDHTDGNRTYENHLFSSERPDIPASLFSGIGIWFQIPFVKVWKFFWLRIFMINGSDNLLKQLETKVCSNWVAVVFATCFLIFPLSLTGTKFEFRTIYVVMIIYAFHIVKQLNNDKW